MLILLLGIGVTVFTMNRILVAQLEREVKEELEQEVGEFRVLVNEIEPQEGESPSRRLERAFATYLNDNVLAPDEALLTYVDGEPFMQTTTFLEESANAEEVLGPELAQAIRSPTSSTSGWLQSSVGEIAYLAAPIEADGEVRGSFVVAFLTQSDREEISNAVRLVALVGLAALFLGSVIAFLGAGRVLEPLRELNETAGSINEGDLARRIDVQGRDELAELGATFNAMLGRLEESFESQRSLIRDVNHELRTPITVVRGHLELLDDDPVERRATIGLVTDELDRMSLLVNELLTLSRAERRDFLQPQPVEIFRLIDDLLEKAGSLGKRTWRIAIADDPGSAVIDRQRINQAMLNLIDNAVQQTSEGQVIEIGADRDDKELRLWVSDEGPGVEPADRERLFEKFERGTARNRYSGSGLGLAIVKAIAEAHGGSVMIEESDLGGARFIVRLPVEPAGVQAEVGFT
jgi:signal transduction histidine kinase